MLTIACTFVGLRESRSCQDVHRVRFIVIVDCRYCAMYKITSARQSCFSVPWANVLTTGKEICVECQNKAMDGGVGNRCVGHGTAEKETFWTAVNTRGCHGWWQRVSELSECSCNSNHGRDFIFV